MADAESLASVRRALDEVCYLALVADLSGLVVSTACCQGCSTSRGQVIRNEVRRLDGDDAGKDSEWSARTVRMVQTPEPRSKSTAKGRRVFLGGISQGCNIAQLGGTL